MAEQEQKVDLVAEQPPVKKEKKLLVPEDHYVQISTRKDARFYIFLSKIILKNFAKIELRALGHAAEICVRVAENLERYNYAHITKIYSETIELNDRDRSRKGARFVVEMIKSDQFDGLTKDFLK